MSLFRKPRIVPLEDVPTRNVAVGSLSGIAPGDVGAHVLIVADDDGNLSMSGVACDEMLLSMLTHAAGIVAKRVFAAHVHDERAHGGANGEAL